MDSKLPKVFVNEIDHDINNSQKTFMSNSRDNLDRVSKTISLSDIDKILSNRSYIYKTKVSILLNNNKSLDTYIVSRTNNNVITIDNEKINISDIKDIKVI